jgi:hypothetical protein
MCKNHFTFYHRCFSPSLVAPQSQNPSSSTRTCSDNEQVIIGISKLDIITEKKSVRNTYPLYANKNQVKLLDN